MAKKSVVARQHKREKIVARYAEKRAELKKIIKKSDNPEEIMAAQEKLNKLPRDSSPIRLRLRCELTGRSRGNYKKFKLSRLMFRELANTAMLPGVTKASW